MNYNPSTRIAICDDHPVIRFGLATALDNEPDLHVVLQASSSEQLLREYSKTQPDVLILDLDLDGNSGIDCLKVLRRNHPAARVIIYSAFTDNDCIARAVELGIQGYHLKRSDCSDIIASIRKVSQGGTSFAAEIVSKLLSRIQSENIQTKAELSNRELQVLQLLAIGKTNVDIANKLYICERTVKFHVSSILTKLGVRNRTEAAIYARNNKIYPLETQ